MNQLLLEPKPAPARWLSSVGAKAVVALTGLALLGFVIVHLLGNLQVFNGPDALNSYAKFLKDRGSLLWAARLGLLAVFVVHVVLTTRLTLQNRAARPVEYQFRNTIQATLASRTMMLSGLVILAFVLYHLAHFTFGFTDQAAVKDPATGQVVRTNYLELHESGRGATDPKRHDVYAMVVHGFRSPVVVAFYVVAQLLLGLHLSHGIGSALQSLGFNHPRYTPWIKRGGMALAVLIVVGNCSIPLAVLAGLVPLPA